MIGLGLLLGMATAITGSAVASTSQSTSVKWFEARFGADAVEGYVFGRIENGSVFGCAFLEDARAGRLDAGCGAIPLYLDPALRSARIVGRLPSEVLDVATGRSLGASTIAVDVWAHATGVPIVAAGHRAFARSVDLTRWTALMSEPVSGVEAGVSTSLVRTAGAFGSIYSSKVCAPVRRSSRSVRLPVLCVRGIGYAASTDASLGEEIEVSVS